MTIKKYEFVPTHGRPAIDEELNLYWRYQSAASDRMVFDGMMQDPEMKNKSQREALKDLKKTALIEDKDAGATGSSAAGAAACAK